jgi:hypothetical protein
LSPGKNLSFFPIIDIIKSWAEIKEDDSDKQCHIKLKNTIERVYPEEAIDVFLFIAIMMGMALSKEDAARGNACGNNSSSGCTAG